jgi:hypothetical protein
MGLLGHKILVRAKDGMHGNCRAEVFQPIQGIEGVFKINIRLSFLLASAFARNTFIDVWAGSTRQIP